MTIETQKLLQYLNEAHASEQALVRVLQSQIAMTPRGSLRDGLQAHLRETESHAQRVASRISDLRGGSNPVTAVVGLAETAIGQVLALSKTPLDLLRGTGGEEKVLKNAKDACATEALEIATYTALEQLAKAVGDDQTAKLAASIRADEEKMLDRLLGEIPKLAAAVVGAEIEGDPSYDVTETGAADGAREAGRATKRAAKRASKSTRKTARQARRVPGVARVEGEVKGALASASDLAISQYDSLTADDVVDRLGRLSQVDLAKVDAYERKHQNRTTVLNRTQSLRGDEPWAGYDELGVAEIVAVLGEGDDERLAKVRTYEREHKHRAGVLNAAERERSNA